MLDEEVNYGDVDEHVEVAEDKKKGDDDASRSASDGKSSSASRPIPTGPRDKTRGNVPTGPRDRSERDRPSGRVESAKESSKPATEASSEAVEDRLPPGWTKTMSRSHGKYFYFHEATGETSWTKPVVTESAASSKNDPLPHQNGNAHQDLQTPALPAASSTVKGGGQANDEASKTQARDADRREDRDARSSQPSRNDRNDRQPPTGPSASSQNISSAYASRRARESAPAPIEDHDRARKRSPSPRRDEPKRFRADEGRRSPFRSDRRDLPRDPPRNTPYDQRPGPMVKQTSNFVTRDYARSRDNNGPGPSDAGYSSERERARGPPTVQGANSAPLTNNRWGSGPPSAVSTPKADNSKQTSLPESLDGKPGVPASSAADDTAAKRAALAEKRRKAEEEIKRLAEEEERLEREEAESRRRKEEEEIRRKERDAQEENDRLTRQQQVEDDRAWRARRDEERRRMDAERGRGGGFGSGRPPNSPPPRPRSPFRGGGPTRSPPRARPLRADAPIDPPRRPGFNPNNGADSYRPGPRVPSPPRGRLPSPPRGRLPSPTRGQFYPPPPAARSARAPDHYGAGDRGPPPSRRSPPPTRRSPPPLRRSPPPPFDRRRQGSPPPPPFRRDAEPFRDSYGSRGPPPRTFAEPMSDLAKRITPRPRSPEPIRHGNPPHRSLAERMSRPVPDDRFDDRRDVHSRR